MGVTKPGIRETGRRKERKEGRKEGLRPHLSDEKRLLFGVEEKGRETTIKLSSQALIIMHGMDAVTARKVVGKLYLARDSLLVWGTLDLVEGRKRKFVKVLSSQKLYRASSNKGQQSH